MDLVAGGLNGNCTFVRSPLFGTKTDYTGYLGGKVRNSSGSVVAATTLLDFWTTEWNPARKVNTSRDQLYKNRSSRKTDSQ